MRRCDCGYAQLGSRTMFSCACIRHIRTQLREIALQTQSKIADFYDQGHDDAFIESAFDGMLVLGGVNGNMHVTEMELRRESNGHSDPCWGTFGSNIEHPSPVLSIVLRLETSVNGLSGS